jgi:hypothetical protein
MGIIAATGQCKTAAVQNILACNASLPGTLFELELSGPQMYERAAAISTGINAWRVSDIYDEGLRVNWWDPGKFANLLTCTASLSMAEIDQKSPVPKLGCLPPSLSSITRNSSAVMARVTTACRKRVRKPSGSRKSGAD